MDEGEKLFRQAAAVKPPSGYAFQALGYHALCEARFAEASGWFEKALPLLSEKTYLRQYYHDSLLASGDFDLLLEALQASALEPGRLVSASMQIMRVEAIRGDKNKARLQLARVVELYPWLQRDSTLKALESVLSCCENDVKGYLQAMGDTPSFEASFLRGQLKEAADFAILDKQDQCAEHGLLYLEATRSGAKELAETHWKALLAELDKGGRDMRLFGQMLNSGKPQGPPSAQRIAIDPRDKRVLLVVLAQCAPDQAKELLALARRLDFHHDAISLCLAKFLKQP